MRKEEVGVITNQDLIQFYNSRQDKIHFIAKPILGENTKLHWFGQNVSGKISIWLQN